MARKIDVSEDLDELLRIVLDFHSFVMQVREMKSVADASVVEADKAFGDIRHLCENDVPRTHKGKTTVVKLMHEYGKRRRKSKDLLMLINPVVEFLDRHKNFHNEFGQLVGEVKKQHKTISLERHYNPRVLKELFKEED